MFHNLVIFETSAYKSTNADGIYDAWYPEHF